MAVVRVVLKWTDTVDGYECLDCRTVRPGRTPNICRCRPHSVVQHGILVARRVYVTSLVGFDDWKTGKTLFGPWEPRSPELA